jgi:hypothetical protein
VKGRTGGRKEGRRKRNPSMAAYSCNPSTWEAEAGG